MSAPGAGVLLALSGDDADILRVLSQAGSGLCVVRRCADLPELLSAGMAGLAGFALLDTGFDEIDRTVLDRLARAGLSGMLLVEAYEEERWLSAGWPVLRRDTEPGRICAALQDLVRRGGASGAASTGTGPAAGSADWLSAIRACNSPTLISSASSSRHKTSRRCSLASARSHCAAFAAPSR